MAMLATLLLLFFSVFVAQILFSILQIFSPVHRGGDDGGDGEGANGGDGGDGGGEDGGDGGDGGDGDGGNLMQPRIPEAGLDPAIISSFPILRHGRAMQLLEGRRVTECAVCLTKYATNDIVRLLTVCGHAFHPDCIDQWLFFKRTCPICRSNLEAAPDEADARAILEVLIGEDVDEAEYSGS